MSATPQPDLASAKSRWSTHPWLGVFGVLLGAMIASFASRLLSVGLVDVRSGLGLGVDEASWLGTVFNSALAFVGPFSVYLGGLLGARRVLLGCSILYTIISLLLPLVGHGPALFILLALAGLTAGTFYPLTLTFILRNLPPKFLLLGISMYAMDIVFTTYIATSVEAWYMDHLSWHWVFWNSVILTPLMFVLIFFGIPRQPLPKPKEGQPRPSWRGFFYTSTAFALLYAALDQGQRLDWLNSGTIVALLAATLFLLCCIVIRRIVSPNPLIDVAFLAQWNIVLLAISLAFFRLLMLAAVVGVPNFLATAQGYKTLQTGSVFFWLALPQIAFSLLAMLLLRWIDTRLLFATGFFIVGIGCLLSSRVTSAWAGENFTPILLVFAFGFAFTFNGLVATIVQQAINVGAMDQPIKALTFSGFFQSARLIGGQLGTAWFLHTLSAREQFHSNVLVNYANAGSAAAQHRFAILRAGMSQHIDISTAAERAAALFGLQLRLQAFTLAIADMFHLLACAALIAMLVIALLKPVRILLRDMIAKQI